MKPERSFIAERPVANHCAELLRPPPPPADLRPALALFGEELARTLGIGLCWLTGGDAPKVRTHALRECTMADLGAEIAPLAANSLLAAGNRHGRFLASLDAEVVLRLVDRAFGGKGEAPAQLPEAFPLSAELLVARLEAVVVAAVVKALDGVDEDHIRSLRRDSNLRRLAPFADEEPLTVLTLDVEEADRDPWKVTFAFSRAAVAEMFNREAETQAAKPAYRVAGDPTAEPFAALPLTVAAVLVDMQLPMARLTGLRPGQILPVAVARNVPLRVGGHTVGYGTVGQVDDRVAVQITQAF